MWTVKKCCCCSLVTGGYVVGIIGAIYAVCYLISLSFLISDYDGLVELVNKTSPEMADKLVENESGKIFILFLIMA